MKNRWVEAMKRGAMVRASPRGRIPTPSQDEEVDEFIHNDERCRSIGECTVATVLDNCMLQGGVHHTHMNVLTYLGNPLRTDWCCYPIRVQWFRAIGDRDDFQAIPFANHEWFTPTADDIGARILAKVTVQDEDVAKTKMLEYGPIKEDPEVRSKVEMYLERKSVLFMGLRSLRAQDGAEYADNEELCESWTLLIDDKRVRLTCESSLLPPFEGLYTNDIRVEIVRETPNELRLYLPSATFVHLRAESNIVRDIIVLTLRAFCKEAVGSEAISDAVSKGISPMLTIRTLSLNERTLLTRPLQSPKAYDLPWYRPNCSPRTLANETTQSTSAEPHDSTGSEISDIVHIASRSPSPATRDDDDDVNDSLLLDVEALIGNALKMGIQNQILPPVRKRISIAEIPDLQIVGKPVSPVCRRQQSGTAEMEASPLRERRLSSDCSTEVDGDTDGVADAQQPELGPSEVEEAIQSFQRQASGDPKADAMRDEYVAIFYALQSDLRQYKERTMQLTRRLEERDEQNAAFRQDIDVLRTALASMQIAEQSQIAEQCKVLLGELPALMEGAPGNTNDTPSGSPVRLPSNQHTRSLSTPQKRQKS
ncbi:TPA: hypothetical protein N0F65_008837 [Lagenidium giganteum]|uniref:Uncharacterized protein n=1 Tax=Lagenidium giganteum TaxID=4803 RepID=A0AAV2YTZ6_9STRA|nr:TPA: hypothetical protein N0F65_008837 [Lagenidium giganteum]